MASDTLPTPSDPPSRALDHLAELADKARAYARSAKAENTHRAYAADWRHYTAWCLRRGVDPLPPDPPAIGLYLADLASEPAPTGRRSRTAATVERRLSGLAWHFRRHGVPLDRGDRHIKEVLAGIRRTHGRPPVQKEALLAEDVVRMLGCLARD